jgi:hypothetical protein
MPGEFAANPGAFFSGALDRTQDLENQRRAPNRRRSLWQKSTHPDRQAKPSACGAGIQPA